MNTKKTLTTISLLITILLSFISCNTNDDIIQDDIKGKVIVTKMTDLRRSNMKRNLNSYSDYSGNKEPYHIQYKDITLDNVYLTTEEANKLRAANGIDTLSLTINGYSKWEQRDTGRESWYARAYASDNPLIYNCGIQPGIYMTKDVWFTLVYNLPTSMAIVIEAPSDYPDYTHMGCKPKVGFDGIESTPGYRASLSGNILTLKTGGFILKYTATGQEVNYTYPFKESNLQWNIMVVMLI